MTDHRHPDDDLKAYADGELPLGRRLAVRRHLARCAACRKELTAMPQISEELRAAEGVQTLPSDLRAKILAAPPAPNSGGAGTDAETSPVPPELGARGRSFRPAYAWAIVSAAVVMWFILYPLSFAHRLGAPTASMVGANVAFRSVAHKLPRQQQERGQSVAAGPPMPATVLETMTRQVHKEAIIAVEVGDAEAEGDQVAQMVKAAGGFVADNTLSTGDDGRKSADLTVKVPVVQFETVLGQVAKLGDVQSKNITGEDITEKTSDADQTEGVLEDEARRADAHLAALGKKAGWRDQQAAQDARIQLAQARARLLLLRKMAVLSTLSISLTEKPKPAAPAPVASGFLGGLGDTTRAASQSLLGTAGALLALLIWVLAYAPVWLPLALIGRFVYRRCRWGAA